MTDQALSIGSDIGGTLIVSFGFGTKLYEWISNQNVSDSVQLVVAIIGLLFLIDKWRGVRLDNRRKRRQEKNDLKNE